MNIATPLNLKINRYLSWDTLLLATFVLPGLEFHQRASAFIVSAVLLYALVDLALGLKAQNDEMVSDHAQRLAFMLKFFLLILICTLVVIVPTSFYVFDRPKGEADPHLHDGAFQTEVALQYLTQGKNPYAETYVGTGLESYIQSDVPENPALHNFVYFPFLLWLSLPFYTVAMATLGWFDQRFIYLFAFLITLILVPQLTNDLNKKLILIVLIGLNYYTIKFVQAGRNDILILALLLIVLILLRTRHIALVGMVLGMACAIKPSAWFLLLFFSVFVTRTLSWRENLRLWLKPLLLFWIVLILTIAPFVLWDAPAFFRSTVAYTLGIGSGIIYPIRGYGFSMLLLSFGIIASPLLQFPFWVFEFGGTIPVLVLMLRKQARDNTINVMLFGFATLFTVFLFFSRFFQENYLQFSLWILCLAIFIDPFKPDAVTSQPESIVRNNV